MPFTNAGVAKIRLGAPDSMLLTVAGTQIDLGGTDGGCELNYNPNNFAVLIDQTLTPVTVFKVEERMSFICALAQYQINLVNMAFAYATSNVTTAVGTPSTDTAYFGSSVFVATGTLDITVPKNDNTTNHLRIHLNKVYSSKTIKFAYMRTKNTLLDKVEFDCLADLTQSSGQQIGWLREEY